MYAIAKARKKSEHIKLDKIIDYFYFVGAKDDSLPALIFPGFEIRF